MAHKNMFKDLTIQQYNQILASNSATPGGGSALAMVGATACSLVAMSLQVTVGKTADEEQQQYLQRESVFFCRTRDCLYRLADEDSTAFERIIEGFALPKQTEEQKEQRKNHLQKCYHRAALVPLDVMSACRDALIRANTRVLQYADKYVASDCAIGIALLKTVIEQSQHNVVANTNLIRDEQLKHRLEQQMKDIAESVKQI